MRAFSLTRGSHSQSRTPQGFPLAYEVMAGNTVDCTMLTRFVEKIPAQYGRAQRIRVTDRGIPTEEALKGLRGSGPPVFLQQVPEPQQRRGIWHSFFALIDPAKISDYGHIVERVLTKLIGQVEWFPMKYIRSIRTSPTGRRSFPAVG